MNETFKKWVEKANQKERKAFVEALFGGLEAKGAVTLDQVKFKDIIESLESMITSDETAKVLLDLPMTYFTTATKHAREAFEQFTEELKQLGADEKTKEKNDIGETKQ